MIKLELGIEQLELILNALGQVSYSISASTIEEIKRQAIPQLAESKVQNVA